MLDGPSGNIHLVPLSLFFHFLHMSSPISMWKTAMYVAGCGALKCPHRMPSDETMIAIFVYPFLFRRFCPRIAVLCNMSRTLPENLQQDALSCGDIGDSFLQMSSSTEDLGEEIGMITDDLGLTALLKRMINMNSRYIHTHIQVNIARNPWNCPNTDSLFRNHSGRATGLC